jgi:predicted amidohydrolase
MLAGNSITVPCFSPVGYLGLSVSYDLRFPELYRKLTLGGAQILMIPSSFTAKTGGAHFETLMRTRAIENQCYVVTANQSGVSDEGVVNFGHSMVIDPWGDIIA